MNREEITCDYRSIGTYLIVAVLIPFLVFMLYVAVRFKNVFLWLIAVVVLLILLYYVMQMLNKRIILTEEYIEEYGITGKVKKYDLCDVTKITVCNGYRERYVLIKIGMKKVKVQKQVRNYNEFESRICKLFNLKGYSRGGTHTYNV